MTMQDLATQVQYRLPIINVVFTNHQYGFIKDEQEDTNKNDFIGVEFNDIDFSKIASGVHMKAFRIDRIDQLTDTFNQARDLAKTEPVLIDAVITGERPLPAEKLRLDSSVYPINEVQAFKQRYAAEDLHPLATYLAKYGLTDAQNEVGQGGF